MKLSEQRTKLDEARKLIQEVVDAREEYFEGRSESWQDGDAGQEYTDQTWNVQNLVDEIEAVEL